MIVSRKLLVNQEQMTSGWGEVIWEFSTKFWIKPELPFERCNVSLFCSSDVLCKLLARNFKAPRGRSERF
ncbi:unnamed protein product [Rhizophagus irregularis]|nr:unnamed protein product [Rhizophagus irregularis]